VSAEITLQAEWLAELARQIEGDVLYDRLSRMLYATDASPYQLVPSALVRPRHRRDCRRIVEFACQHRLPIIPRAAGTSLAGQCVGQGLVIDVSRYMRRILAIDADRMRAWVEPGVTPYQLNETLQASGLMFAPDPSTSAYCTIGGMVGNNAWGIHSLGYGATRENVFAVEALLSDASAVCFNALTQTGLEQKLQLANREGAIYRSLLTLVKQHQDLMRRHFSAPDGISRNAGYALDYLVQSQRQENGGFNLAPFLCGSEGTLVLLTAIGVKLIPVPKQRFLWCLHFDRIEDALTAVPDLLAHQPVALELIDREILRSTENNPRQQANRFWLQGEPAAVLLIEWHGQVPERTLADTLPAYAVTPVAGQEAIERVWALRKAGLGSLMGRPGLLKAVTGIEDAAVAVNDLAAYLSDVRQILSSHTSDCVVYGPVGRGVLHLRPWLDLNQDADRQKFQAILDAVARIVLRYRGVVSAKHGDGRLRGPYLQTVFGEQVLALFRQVKKTFDPQALFNPGKMLDAPSPLADLRFSEKAFNLPFPAGLDGAADAGLQAASQKCNGAGVCLRRRGDGGMCPSYRLTGEEKHGTRGRANIIRQVLSKTVWNDSEYADIRQVLDLCLACKACKNECSANVDMARMKAMFRYMEQQRYGISWRDHVLNQFERLSYWASWLPGVGNRLLSASWLKKGLGIHRQRSLPKLAAYRFSQWYARHRKPPDHSRADVVLVLDPYSEYYEPDIAIAALTVLERLQLNVVVSPCLPMGRIQISSGLLDQARRRLGKAVDWLYPFAEAGIPLLGLEASELLTLRDEAPLLSREAEWRNKIAVVARQAFLIDEFLVQQAALVKRLKFTAEHDTQTIFLHSHCHQKALSDSGATRKLLAQIPNTDLETVAAGCCGMAGHFGYEQEHYAVSLQIAEMALFPALRKAGPDTWIVATGTGCRHQIRDGLGMRAYHPVELFARFLIA